MMDLRRFIEENWVRNGKICHFWAELALWDRYPLCRGDLIPVPIDRRGPVPVPIKVVPVPMLQTTLFLHTLHC